MKDGKVQIELFFSYGGHTGPFDSMVTAAQYAADLIRGDKSGSLTFVELRTGTTPDAKVVGMVTRGSVKELDEEIKTLEERIIDLRATAVARWLY